MIILGIETASDVGSVAIVEDEILKGEVRINKRFSQSRNLIQSIEYLFRALELRGTDLDGIAISIGPGSYTGLRIGLSVAKSLAYSWEKPLLAVNSLDSFAQLGRGYHRLICPVIRFRRTDYYYAFYHDAENEIQRRSDYQVASLQEIMKQVEEPALFCGGLHPDDQGFFEVKSEGIIFNFLFNSYPSAYWVAFLSGKNLQRGTIEDPNRIIPFYMHDFPV